MKNNITESLSPYLKGIGQIMLQENALTGLLFLIGILSNSLMMGIAAIVSVFVGTMTAKLLKYDKDEINAGLYGFNATLVGVGLIFYFDSSLIIWAAIILLSSLTAVIMNFCLRKKIPIFTFPFIFILWIAIFIYPETHHLTDEILIADSPIAAFEIKYLGLGFGEVMFQGSLLSGLIFFTGVYMNSRIAALYGVFGVVFSVMIAVYYKDNLEHVSNGLFGFNALLCAITFSGFKKRDIIYVLIAATLSVYIEDFMLRHELEILTFPFVLATWITLLVKKYTNSLFDTFAVDNAVE
jgi:urea transporter